MRVRFEQVDAKEKEQALIRAVGKTADILSAILAVCILFFWPAGRESRR